MNRRASAPLSPYRPSFGSNLADPLARLAGASRRGTTMGSAMQSGLDGSKRPATRRWTSRIAAEDRSAWELLPLSALIAETQTKGVMTDIAPGAARIERLIHYAALLREIARRGGQVEMLARAASAATRARREAGADKALLVAALYAQAETQRLGFLLFADAEAAETARVHAEEALALNPAPLAAARLKALKARLQGALALALADRDAMTAALEALEVSIKVLAALRAPDEEVAAVAADRADLLIGLGQVRHDAALLTKAEAELGARLERMDADRAPITWMRLETLRGQALAAIGDVAGDAACIAEAVAALKAAAVALPRNHAPLDEARAGHALGLALQAMGEACEEEALFDKAVKAFSPALAVLDRTPTLPYRALVAHDGAVCLARRAERRGDLKALETAEAAFRAALKARKAAADPLAWAVTQVALARIYEAQSGLRPDTGERADAAFALASALEIFTEQGMRSLAATTLNALDRLKERV